MPRTSAISRLRGFWIPRSSVGRVERWTVVALGAVVLILAQPFATATPSSGLDPSWMTALNLAQVQDLQFGSDVSFTYGPWGYLTVPVGLSTWIVATAWLFSGCALMVFFTGVHRILFGALRPGLAAACAALASVVCGWVSSASWLMLLGLSMLVLEQLGRTQRVSNALLLGGSVVAPLLMLIKISEGVLAVSLLLLVCLVRRSIRDLLVCVGLLALGLLAWWLAAGQRLTDLLPWLRQSADLMSGYAEAMSTGGFAGWPPAVFLVGAALGIGVVEARRSGQPNWSFWAAWTLTTAFCLRIAFIRDDPPHQALLYVALLPVVLLGARPGPTVMIRGSLAGLALLVAVGQSSGLSRSSTDLSWREAYPFTFSVSARHEDLSRSAAAARESYAVSSSVLESLRGHPVAVDPFQVTLVWAYGLEWGPVPVFQPYAAFTPALDRLNANALLRDPDQRVIREHDSIDHRHQLWDSPAYSLTLLCHFDEQVRDTRWTVLGRVADQCGAPQTIGAQRALAGTAIRVPQVGEDRVLIMRFTPDPVSPGTRLLDELIKPVSHLVVELGAESYRVPTALAGGPLMVSIPAEARWAADETTEATTVGFSRAGEVRFESLPFRSHSLDDAHGTG